MNTCKYIYELPYEPRKNLCIVLDSDDQWEVLGGVHMKYDYTTLQDIANGRKAGVSPTDTLLTKWGNKNHTIVELFALLSRMKHFRGMRILQNYVPNEFKEFVENKQTVNIIPPSYKDGACGGMVTCDIKLDSSMSESRKNEKSLTSDNFASKLNDFGDSSKKQNNYNKNLDLEKMFNIQTVELKNCCDKSQEENNELHQPSKPNSPIKSEETQECDKVLRMEMEALSYLSVNIPYKELLLATDGFMNENIIGKGGFGAVYRGMWKNTLVAVKRILQKTSSEGEELSIVNFKENITELKALCQYRHDNILPLYGFSLNGPEPCIVCQFMPCGSLEDRILCRRNLPPLSWVQRFNIGRGTACGLQYLHTCTVPLVHGDIKSANILLDKNLEPKIADFGLAREGPTSNYTHMKVSKINGTRPYLPTDYLRSKQLSTKVDSYSFGIVQYEIATGLRAYCSSRKMFLRDVVVETLEQGDILSMKDINGGPDPLNIFGFLMRIGQQSSAERRKERPSVVEILKEFDNESQFHNDILNENSCNKTFQLCPISIQRKHSSTIKGSNILDNNTIPNRQDIQISSSVKQESEHMMPAEGNITRRAISDELIRQPGDVCRATNKMENCVHKKEISTPAETDHPIDAMGSLPQPPNVLPKILKELSEMTLNTNNSPLQDMPAPLPLLSALGVNIQAMEIPLTSESSSENSYSDSD